MCAVRGTGLGSAFNPDLPLTSRYEAKMDELGVSLRTIKQGCRTSAVMVKPGSRAPTPAHRSVAIDGLGTFSRHLSLDLMASADTPPPISNAVSDTRLKRLTSVEAEYGRNRKKHAPAAMPQVRARTTRFDYRGRQVGGPQTTFSWTPGNYARRAVRRCEDHPFRSG